MDKSVDNSLKGGRSEKGNVKERVREGSPEAKSCSGDRRGRLLVG